jgi:hypothetical protein
MRSRSHSEHLALAQQYRDCAERHTTLADLALNSTERAYHIATAHEYLLLAEGELSAAKPTSVAARKASVGSRHPSLMR